MRINFQDCARREDKVEVLKELFNRAYEKAIKTVKTTKKELTRPLTKDEEAEYQAYLEGRTSL